MNEPINHLAGTSPEFTGYKWTESIDVIIGVSGVQSEPIVTPLAHKGRNIEMVNLVVGHLTLFDLYKSRCVCRIDLIASLSQWMGTKCVPDGCLW